ncbi:nitronate monooxygenase [Marivibrio halodurans]|uniref:Nitronate monooxygenase n=1 Tax=Marivibrio halodurans TaxID=2039722 RepID=A0A8J7V276_9PROT|nr:nitronate monooxygenase [Marivibrio halodurans]MBP5856871.1 nitronate monooxygenase [Marivibrio halodurans]
MTPDELLAQLKVPAIASPMFLVSGPDLVVETCRGGVLGTFPTLNQRTSEGFDQWLTEIEERLAAARQAGERPAPFGINLIVHASNPRVEADLEIAVRHQVPVVITSLGIRPEVIEAVHGYGGLVFHDVVQGRHARKAAEAGVDGLIAVCAGAGGHAGTLNPFAFTDEIRRFFDGLVILAGGISDGHQVAAARMMGADLAYMGTRFIATAESRADPDYKRMILEAGTADIVYTPEISGVPANFLKASLERNGLDGAGKGPDAFDFGEREAKAWRDVWSAGHGVTSIDDLPATADLCARLVAEYRDAAGRLRFNDAA